MNFVVCNGILRSIFARFLTLDAKTSCDLFRFVIFSDLFIKCSANTI